MTLAELHCWSAFVKKAIHLALLAMLTFMNADHLGFSSDRAPAPVVRTIASAPHYFDTLDTYLRVLAEDTFPDNLNAALSVLHCESSMGRNPDAWDVSAPDGGPYQINRQSWERFFLTRYGWTWEQITHDAAINTAAARIIYDRTGDWSAWSCDPAATAAAKN
jgi:hypothetical protein